ncbi:BolA family protein [Silvanigrella aquatica]|uniref:BolA family transcriptional regulator n=1 Tax=Silvanigrella aquatica TaxID=1915309 RepID=A0A1L4CWU2_9BACT|nr:BolA family protein [Silvanigrella aquatica]APJ02421.1 BolA family transcriptional regulator [Silvanigrella aquatica]
MSIKSSIETKLQEKLKPIYLKVENESHRHSVPKGSESHFRIEIVSPSFENKSLLIRHRFVNEIIKEEISKIRACSLHTLTQEEWDKKNGKMERSPTCAGVS